MIIFRLGSYKILSGSSSDGVQPYRSSVSTGPTKDRKWALLLLIIKFVLPLILWLLPLLTGYSELRLPSVLLVFASSVITGLVILREDLVSSCPNYNCALIGAIVLTHVFLCYLIIIFMRLFSLDVYTALLYGQCRFLKGNYHLAISLSHVPADESKVAMPTLHVGQQ